MLLDYKLRLDLWPHEKRCQWEGLNGGRAAGPSSAVCSRTLRQQSGFSSVPRLLDLDPNPSNQFKAHGVSSHWALAESKSLLWNQDRRARHGRVQHWAVEPMSGPPSRSTGPLSSSTPLTVPFISLWFHRFVFVQPVALQTYGGWVSDANPLQQTGHMLVVLVVSTSSDPKPLTSHNPV